MFCQLITSRTKSTSQKKVKPKWMFDIFLSNCNPRRSRREWRLSGCLRLPAIRHSQTPSRRRLCYKLSHKPWYKNPRSGQNGTYPFSYGLGVIIVSLGIMIALYPIWPQVSAVGSFLLIFMSLTTLSFLVTTPEAWVPALGDSHHGFPYLSGAGRLIVKDCIMLGAATLTMADAEKTYLKRSA
jgi:uncharacterized membrane protein YkgB